MKKRILIITTGGTIASIETPHGLIPALSSEELLSYLPDIGGQYSLTTKSILNLDSTDIEPEHWITMAEAVREHYDDYDGFVIIHGTDTMAYSAAALSYLIQNSSKPIVLTGAQKPIGMEITDAKSNLRDSIIYAADLNSYGVQVVFDGKVIAGTRAKKTKSLSYAAFSSINYPHLAVINDGRIVRFINETKPDEPVAFYNKLNKKIFLLKLTPGISPDLIEAIFRLNDCVIIESFGVGGLPASLEDKLFEQLDKYNPSEKVLVMTTQVTYEGSNLSTYEVGRRLKSRFRIPEARDMTLEVVITKMMWILSDPTLSWDEISEKFYSPVQADTLY
ncbi:MAG: asparaginase [Clostridiales bacterium]|nr:asparaginase [Clostridiales bacterium]